MAVIQVTGCTDSFPVPLKVRHKPGVRIKGCPRIRVKGMCKKSGRGGELHQVFPVQIGVSRNDKIRFRGRTSVPSQVKMADTITLS